MCPSSLRVDVNSCQIAALEGYNKAFVLVDGALLSYSLELLVRTANGQSPRQTLEASQEKLSPRSGTVQFFRLGFAFDKALGMSTLADPNRAIH